MLIFRWARRVDPRGLTRLTAFVLSVWAVAMVFALGRVRADFDEALLGLGDDLARLDQSSLLSSETLVVNGARLAVSTAMHRGSLEEVLDRAETACRDRDGQLEEQLQQALQREGDALSPVVRAQGEQRGYVACIGMRVSVTPEGIVDLAKTFLATGDLTSVGTLHYVYARASETGTHVITVESAGPVRPMEMFPEHGDAPGFDCPLVTRPAGLRRLVSAGLEQRPYGLAAYAVESRDPNAVLEDYRRDLERRGYQETTATAWSEAEGEGAIFAERGRHMVAIVASRDESGVSIAVMTTPSTQIPEVSP